VSRRSNLERRLMVMKDKEGERENQKERMKDTKKEEMVG